MRLSRPIRLLGEILLIFGLAEVVVMWVMPVLAPGLDPLQEGLLDVALLLSLAAPTLYWRAMVYFQTPRSPHTKSTANPDKQFSFAQAVTLAVTVQVLGLVATAAGLYFLHRDLKAEAAAAFSHEAERLETEISRRFNQINYGLSGLRANLAAAAAAHTLVPLPRPVFAAHVAARNMRAEFAGVRGFGFIERLPRSAIGAYERQMQADSAPQFQVHTSGDTPDVLVIRNIEPLAENQAALGFDVGQEPVRREGAERAITSGQASLTGKVSLVQDAQRTPGFLLYLPVYREGQAPYLSDLRPATLVGLLYAPVVAQELLYTTRTVTQSHLDFALYDGNGADAAGLVYSDQLPATDGNASTPHHGEQHTVRVGGRNLTLVMQSTPEFDALQDRSSLAITGVGGAVLSMLAALATWLLAAGRLRAQNLAQRMTHDLDRLAQVVQHTHNAVAITNAEGTIEWINAGFSRILGYSSERARGSSILSFVASEATDQHTLDKLLQELRAGKSARTEMRLRAQDGRAVWFDTEVQPIVDGGGAVSGFMQIATEITRQKKAQLQIEAAMREAATLLSAFEAHAIVSITDRQGAITEVNDAFCAISGYSRQELLGANHRLVNSGTHPREFWVAMWANIATGKSWRGDVCNRSKEGQLYWVDNIITPFVGDDGQVERYVSIRTDITHRYEQAQALRDAVQRAEQASLAKGQFLATMSHEIRTPMNAILGMLRLLQNTALSTQQADYTDKSRAATEALLGLINDILDFSKIEAGKMALDPQPLYLDQLLRSLAVILSVNAQHKAVEILYDIDQNLPACVLCDGLRLQQVLTNLGGNAVKFTDHGEVVVALRVVQADSERVRLQFSVKDSGIGIAPENQARIFSGFSQAEASTTRKFGGTGLGLAISRHMVELMGGTLGLESVLGQGSTFHFTLDLPLVAQDQAPAPALADGAGSKKCSALVIDDNPVARALITRMVSAWGWTVYSAGDGMAALQLLQGPTPPSIDVVYVDWEMPVLDGWETTARLRAHCTQAGLTQPTVVMVSAHGREHLVLRTAQEQALLNAFVVKPMTASMLFDATVQPGPGGDALRTSPRSRGSSLRRLRGMRLLVVEDNLINQQVAEELLASEGALVALAANGQLGVEAVAAAQPQFDAVLMDVQMPVMDGYAATRAIRTSLGLNELPIVAMTANALDSDRAECLAVGMDAHVGKPFDLDRLVQTLLDVSGFEPAAMDANDAQTLLPLSGSSLPVIAGLDVAGAVARLGGMLALYLRSAHDFQLALPAVMPQLRRSVHSEPALAAMQVHTLKGNAATLGADALAANAAAVEQVLKSAPLNETTLSAALAQLELQIAQTQQALEALAAAQHATPVPAATAAAPAWHATVQALAELLAQDDYAALDLFARERETLAAMPAAALAALEEALQGLELAQAHGICTEALAAHA